MASGSEWVVPAVLAGVVLCLVYVLLSKTRMGRGDRFTVVLAIGSVGFLVWLTNYAPRNSPTTEIRNHELVIEGYKATFSVREMTYEGVVYLVFYDGRTLAIVPKATANNRAE